MSLNAEPVGPIPEETSRVARAAFPKGNVYIQMRDVLGVIYDDASFRPLFAVRGHPANHPWRLALVTVMQFAEGLSDRQAAEAVRARIDWKYALGLELTDAGFDFSVLSEFRTRLIGGSAEMLLLDALLTACKARDYLKLRGRQRTDSTHVLGVLRVLNRLELVAETLRAALNAVATAAPAWLQALAAPEWFERYGRRIEEFRLPRGNEARQEYAVLVGLDGMRLLAAIDEPTAPPEVRLLPAVEVLRRTWVQQYVTLDERLQ
jgi:transposase